MNILTSFFLSATLIQKEASYIFFTRKMSQIQVGQATNIINTKVLGPVQVWTTTLFSIILDLIEVTLPMCINAMTGLVTSSIDFP